MDETPTCVICLCNVEETAGCYLLENNGNSCRHMYHMSCIASFLDNLKMLYSGYDIWEPQVPACAICRKEFMGFCSVTPGPIYRLRYDVDKEVILVERMGDYGGWPLEPHPAVPDGEPESVWIVQPRWPEEGDEDYHAPFVQDMEDEEDEQFSGYSSQSDGWEFSESSESYINQDSPDVEYESDSTFDTRFVENEESAQIENESDPEILMEIDGAEAAVAAALREDNGNQDIEQTVLLSMQQMAKEIMEDVEAVLANPKTLPSISNIPDNKETFISQVGSFSQKLQNVYEIEEHGQDKTFQLDEPDSGGGRQEGYRGRGCGSPRQQSYGDEPV